MARPDFPAYGDPGATPGNPLGGWVGKLRDGFNDISDRADSALSQITSILSTLSGKANDNAVVHLAGTETVTGAKTFSLPISGAAPTADAHLVTRAYYTANLPAGGGSSVNPFGSLRVNVQSPAYGAKGDGTTDDTAAINAAISAAGIGGTVYFPATNNYYKVSSPLKPLNLQTWSGEEGLRYAWDAAVTSGSVIRASSSFSGAAVIYNSASNTNGASNAISYGVTIRNLAIFGDGAAGEDGAIDGIDFGPASGRERGWLISGVRFMYLGVALAGFMWASTFEKFHITRCGYGISPSRGVDANSRIQDCTFSQGFIYFNKNCGIELTGAVESGMVTLGPDLRVERTGVSMDPLDPNTNRNANADGILITRATSVNIIGVTTDANARNGLRLAAVSHGAVNNVTCLGNIWKRDGTGDNSATTIAGVYANDTLLCSFIGDKITYGDPNDSGPGRIAPQYGFEYGNNDFLRWIGEVQLDTNANIKANAYKNNGGNYRSSVQDVRSSIDTIPYVPTTDLPTPLVGSTLIAYDTTAAALKIAVNGAAWAAVGGGGGGSAPATNVTTSQSEYDALATKDPAVAYYVQAPGGVNRTYQAGQLFSEYTKAFTGRRNTLSGVASGTAITTANSGGTSGTAFDTVSGTVVAQNSSDLTTIDTDRGFNAALSNATGAYVAWTHPDYVAGGWVRLYCRRSATPSVSQRVTRGHGSDATIRWEVRWQADGSFLLANTAGETLCTVTGATGLGTVYRVELNPATKDMRVYVGDTLTPIATPTVGTGTPATGDWVQTRFGLMVTAAQTMNVDIASPAVIGGSANGPIGLA